MLWIGALLTLAVQKSAPPPQLRRSVSAQHVNRRAALTAAAAASLAAASTPAHAGFGPSGGAVISDAPLKQLSLENLLQLSPQQQQKRTSSLSIERARELVQQLNENAGSVTQDAIEELSARVAEAMRGEQESSPTGPAAALQEQLNQLQQRQKEFAQQRELQLAIEERERLLTRLAAQPAWIAYGAALCASFASTSVMHPVDTYKTLQMSGRLDNDDGSFGPEVLPKLYTGLSGNLLKEVPPSALYLGVYELVKDVLIGRGGLLGQYPLLIYLISGAVGEFTGSIVRAPSEAAKTLVQSGRAETTIGAFQILGDTPESRAGVVNTWFSSVLRDVPFGAIQIAVFEGLKSYIVQSPDISFDTDSVLSEALLGAIGGFIGAFVSSPFDVVVTRLISQDRSGERVDAFSMAQRIAREEGPTGFFRGSGARVLYWAPAIGIFLGLYCTLRKLALDMGI